MFFKYGKKELEKLSESDSKMKALIQKFGKIKRKIEPDLYSSIIHNIIAQQISTKAEETIWKRTNEYFGRIAPNLLKTASVSDFRNLGISAKKAEWIIELSEKIDSRQFDLEKIKKLSDEEAIRELSSLRGIGVWTAEMLLLFALGRKDIFSFNDFGIHRGLQKVYSIDKIDKVLFEKFRQKFSPYGSIASFYLWAAASEGL